MPHLNNPMGELFQCALILFPLAVRMWNSMYILWTLLIIMVPLLAFHEFLPGSLNKLRN